MSTIVANATRALWSKNTRTPLPRPGLTQVAYATLGGYTYGVWYLFYNYVPTSNPHLYIFPFSPPQLTRVATIHDGGKLPSGAGHVKSLRAR